MPIKTQSATKSRVARGKKSRVKPDLEGEFAARWACLFPDLKFEREVQFHPVRKFRFDFCFAEAKVAVEISGQLYRPGAHSTGKGIERDYFKLNLAQSHPNNWIVFQLSAAMARDEAQLRQIAATVRARTEEKS